MVQLLYTINSFFKSKPIDYLNFAEIAQKLSLDSQAIASSSLSNSFLVTSTNIDLMNENSHSKPNLSDNIPDILIIDDCGDRIESLSHILSNFGYKARTSLNLTVALATVEAFPPDLILLNIFMSQVDGYDVCQILKSCDRDISVIFIGISNEVLDQIKDINLVNVDFITLPLQAVEVMARVNNQLTIRYLRNQLKQQNYQLQQEIESRLEITRVIKSQNSLPQKATSNQMRVKRRIKSSNQTRQTTETSLQAQNIDLIYEASDRLTLTNHLKDKEQQLSALIANIPGVVYRTIFHPDGRVSMPYISPRIEELLGITTKEFTENFEWIFDVVHPEDRMELYRVLDESKRQNTALDHEYRLPQEHNHTKWVRILAQPHQLENKDIIWDGVIIDISQQKNMEIAYELLLESMEIDYKQSEELLQNLFPHEISQHLKQSNNPIASNYESVSVLFADIVGFTQISSVFSPTQTVELLNRIFSSFDYLTKEYGLEKIKTIGDQYMVVGGIPNQTQDHAEAIADLALRMQAEIAKFYNHLNQPMSLRVGISTGAVVAGVIGTNKFVYDIWGDTVNIASRMESHGEADKIQVSESTYLELKDRYIFEKRGKISIKGKGVMNTYWLTDKNIPQT